MASFNRVILVGNITRDIELRHIQSGTAVTEIGLAVNDRRKGSDGNWTNETTFVDVTLWGRTAEIANQYLSKGSSILIEGRLKLDSWTSNEGQKRTKLRVVGENMTMLGSRSGGNNQGGNQGYSNQSYGGQGGQSGSNYGQAEAGGFSGSEGAATFSPPDFSSGGSAGAGPSGDVPNDFDQSIPDDDIPF
ncbi:MAG: single-stranded DNA-binding protein [Pirellulaceae bacterium]|nr:single-stranded DNA-binding protein [Pirellulaceae bacterium]